MKINSDRMVVLFGKINHESAGKTLERIHGLWQKDKEEEIFLLISSGGGLVDPAFMLVDMIMALGINITTIGSGGVGSIAVPVFAVGKTRLITRHTDFFLHELGSTFDKEERLSTSEIRAKQKSLETAQVWYAEFIAERTEGKFQTEKVLAVMKAEAYLLPDQLKECGLVHEII